MKNRIIYSPEAKERFIRILRILGEIDVVHDYFTIIGLDPHGVKSIDASLLLSESRKDQIPELIYTYDMANIEGIIKRHYPNLEGSSHPYITLHCDDQFLVSWLSAIITEAFKFSLTDMMVSKFVGRYVTAYSAPKYGHSMCEMLWMVGDEDSLESSQLMTTSEVVILALDN